MSSLTDLDIETQAVVLSAIINGATGCVYLILFEYCRSQNKVVYEPRKFSHKYKTCSDDLSGFLNWVSGVQAVTDEETLRIVGLDAFVLLKYLRMLSQAFFVAGVLGAICLLPVYWTAENSPLVGINRLSMGSIQVSSDRLWVPWLFAWIFTLYFLYLMHNEYKEFANLRQLYFKNPGDDFPLQSSYSCMIENLPPSIKSDNELKKFFQEIFPNEVHSATIAFELQSLELLMTARDVMITQYENAVVQDVVSNHVKQPMVAIDKMNQPAMCGGQKVPAIEYYRFQIEKLTQEIETKRAALSNAKITSAESRKDTANLGDQTFAAVTNVFTVEEGALSSTGFVTFTSIRTAVAASQCRIISSSNPQMRLYPAASPSDIIWNNITVPKLVSDNLKFVVALLLWAGVAFWAVIIAFIGTISQFSVIAGYLPFLKLLPQFFISLLTAFLPIIILSVFLSLIPMIIGAFAESIEGRKFTSEVEYFVCGWFFLYSMANVYLILLSGSVVNSIQQLIANPFSIVYSLGQAIPAQAVFFINFMFASWLVGIPSRLSRLVPLILNFIFSKLLKPENGTIRGFLQGVLAPVNYDYGTEIPGLLYIVAIVMLYWIIAPVVLLIGFCYFWCIYHVLKYEFLFINIPKYESGGKFFYLLYGYTMVALMFSCVTIVGYMALRLGATQTALLVPLPIVTMAVWRYTEYYYKELSEAMAMDIATAKDGEFVKKFDAPGHNASTRPNLFSQRDNIELAFQATQVEHKLDMIFEDAPLVGPNHNEIVAQFKADFYEQPAYQKEKTKPRVFPYRFDGVPLLNSQNELDPAYFDALDLNASDLEKYDPLEPLVGEEEPEAPLAFLSATTPSKDASVQATTAVSGVTPISPADPITGSNTV